MTRKEELTIRAMEFLANEHTEPTDLVQMLQQVEREVWSIIHERLEKKFEAKEDFREWVRAQKELE